MTLPDQDGEAHTVKLKSYKNGPRNGMIHFLEVREGMRKPSSFLNPHGSSSGCLVPDRLTGLPRQGG